jgi:DNA primase
LNISKETITIIKENVDIVDVVSDYVRTLKKSGKNWLGLCPFHNEKHPSFTVSNEIGKYKCFSCGVSGDVVEFLMKIENISFVEAVVILAKRAGVTLDMSPEEAGVSYKKDELIQFNTRIHKLFHFFLLNREEGQRAREYLNKREIDIDTIKRFNLGYIPGGFWLEDFLRKKGFQENFLRETGIFSVKNGKLRAMFFDRLMFPIFNYRNECIGFGGRVLSDDAKPKYLNSPETFIYKKSSVLYGIQFAKDEMKKRGYAFLVEGYMDVIACHKNGLTNAVAPCGTAITKEQLKLVSRYCGEIILLLDGDAAGLKGAVRALKEGINLEDIKFSVIPLPNGMDPDEYFKENQMEDFEKLLENRIEAFDFCIEYKCKDVDLKDYQVLSGVLKFLFEYIATWESGITQNLLLQRLSDKLSLNLGTIEQEYKRYLGSKKNSFVEKEIEKANDKKDVAVNAENENVFLLDSILKKEIDLILYLLFYDESEVLVEQCELKSEFFSNQMIADLFNFSKENHFSKEVFLENLTDVKLLNYVTERLLSPDFDTSMITLKHCAVDLILALIKRFWQKKGNEINEQIKLSEMYKDLELISQLQNEKMKVTNEILKLSRLQELKK